MKKHYSNPHIPKILIGRLIDQKYTLKSEVIDNVHHLKAVVMVLDISGFTNLSIKASLDELKNIVNNYFSFLLDVIEEFKGDVIKFAGDALQVVWPIEDKAGSDYSYDLVISNALECALQINKRFCFIRVFSDNFSVRRSENTEDVKETDSEISDSYYTLSIHSGMAVGTVVAIDLFRNQRREYFITGDAVIDSFKGVNLADPGTLVMTSSCFSYMHTQSDLARSIPTESLDSCFVRLALVPSGHIPSMNTKFNRESSVYKELHISIDTKDCDSIYDYLHEAIRPENNILNITDQVIDSKKIIKLKPELRNIVCIFISLMIDINHSACSELDSESSTRIVNSTILQKCFTVCNDSLQETGGQLRQFMYDDKGYICIGTFGLSSSVTKNNCSAGINCARNIMLDLNKMGVKSSIGVTYGRAYCGLIGSASRCEYTVMGKSINLAARLMASAQPGTILCDLNIRSRDDEHSFISLMEIKAKGYSNKVTVFSPIRSSSLLLAHFPPSLVDIIKAFSNEKYLGRIDEICEITQYLVSNNVLFQDQENSGQDSKIVVIASPVGFGKSALAEAIIQIMESIKHVHISCLVLKIPCIKSERNSQFYWCKKLFSKLFRYTGSQVNNKNSKTFNLESLNLLNIGVKEYDDELITGIIEIISTSEPEIRFNFLRSINFIYPEICDIVMATELGVQIKQQQELKSITATLTVSQSLSFLSEILKKFIFMIKEPITIFIDDIQYIDALSINFIESVFKSNLNLTLISTLDINEGSENLPDKKYNLRKNSDKKSLVDENNSFQSISKVLSNLAQSNQSQSKSKSLLIQLGPLTPIAISQIANIIIKNNIHQNDLDCESVISPSGRRLSDTVFELSGGNASLATEFLEVAISQSSLCTVEEIFYNLELFRENSELENSQNLIEFHFDKLSLQLKELLKIISVIATKNTSIDLNLLEEILTVYILKNNNLFGSIEKTNLSNLLFDLIERNKFLKLVDVSGATLPFMSCLVDSDSGDNDIKRDSNIESNNFISFEFRNSYLKKSATISFISSHHQLAVYDLMLSDQLKGLHKLVAATLEAQYSRLVTHFDHSRLTVSDWERLGYHWEVAKEFDKAMVSYYQAGKRMEDISLLNEANIFYCSGYNMLQTLFAEAGVQTINVLYISNGEVNHKSIENSKKMMKRILCSSNLLEMVDSLCEETTLEESIDKIENEYESVNFQDIISLASEAFSAEFKNITQIQIYNAFKGDTLTLEMSLDLIIALNRTNSFVNAKFKNILLSEALQIISLSHKKSILSHDQFTFRRNCNLDPKFYQTSKGPVIPKMPHISSIKSINSINSDYSELSTDTNNHFKLFYLQNIKSVFTILSGIIMKFILKEIPDDINQTKLKLFTKSYLNIAQSYGEDIHIIRALSFLIISQSETAEYEQAAVSTEQIIEIYSPDTHMELLIETYGVDRGFQSISYSSLYQFIGGNFSLSKKFYDLTLLNLHKIKHLHTLLTSMLPLCSIMILCEDYPLALDLFQNYYVNEQLFSGNKMFKDNSPYLIEWLLQLIASTEEKEEKKEDEETYLKYLECYGSHESRSNCIKLISETGTPIFCDRNINSSVTELLLGNGVDRIRAALCFFQAKFIFSKLEKGLNEKNENLSKDKIDVIKYSLSGIKALDFNISKTCNTLTKLNSIWQKVDILLFIEQVKSDIDINDIISYISGESVKHSTNDSIILNCIDTLLQECKSISTEYKMPICEYITYSYFQKRRSIYREGEIIPGETQIEKLKNQTDNIVDNNSNNDKSLEIESRELSIIRNEKFKSNFLKYRLSLTGT